MYGRAVRRMRRLSDSLRHCRMRMYGANQFLDGRLEPQRQANLRSEHARQYAFELRDELVDVNDRSIETRRLTNRDQLTADMKRAVYRAF